MSFLRGLVCAVLSISAFLPVSLAQRVTGHIDGTIVDPSNASISGARVTATEEATGLSRQTASDGSGLFRIIELSPGTYRLKVQSPGFRESVVENVVVRVASVTSLIVTLGLQTVTETTEVRAADVGVDTTSTVVGGTITTKQIEQLAIIGRNVMDLAQLEPGVQIRDGGDIDPTKNGFSGVSIQGRGGRETQVQWDGLTVQDETVGSSVVNISLDSIEEFQVAQATLDPAQSVASGGALNIVSRHGANNFHGSLYEFYRNQDMGAPIAGITAPFQRNQFGARAGGPMVKDKLFFFASAERTHSNDSFVGDAPAFPQFKTFYPKPFRDDFSLARVDWTISPRYTAFARFSYSKNNGTVGFPSLGGTLLDGFSNRTQANVFGSGLTFAGANWIHQLRFGHVGFYEHIGPTSGLPNPVDSRGREFSLFIDNGTTLAIGPGGTNTDETENQRTWQGKYDGSFLHGRHTFRFGFDLVRWYTLGNYPLLINGPQLNSLSALSTSSDPMAYPLVSALFGNGQGFLSEKPVLGLPHGGTFQWRPALYYHDTWKLLKNLTLNYGLRWFFMSDIVNADLKRDPLLDQFMPGLSRPTISPKTNFSPELGISWDPQKNGKTVIRGGGSLQYEELTVNVAGLDRVPSIPASIGLNFAFLTSGLPLLDPRTGNPFPAGDSLASSFGFPAGTSAAVLNPLFGQPIGAVATQMNDLSLLYQSAAALAAKNPSGPTNFQLLHAISFVNNFTLSWFPDPKTPRVATFNVGIQRELRRNLVFTGEYVGAYGYDFPLRVDVNRIGEASPTSFDRGTALSAISITNGSLGCPADSSGASIDCAIRAGATISSYGANGLGAGYGSQGFAFRGRNPKFGNMDFLKPLSTSFYNALDLKLEGHLKPGTESPLKWMQDTFLTFSYTLSRKTGNLKPSSFFGIADQAYFPSAWDNNKPGSFSGPFTLDRTHILNLSAITDIKGGFRISEIVHWFTALPQNTVLPIAFGGCDGGPSEVFCTDVTGDGTTGDLLPTAPRPGAFGRDLKGASGLNGAIKAYNQNFANNLTPAGQLLVSQHIFTTTQLQALGGVMPTLPLAPVGEAGLDPFFTIDLRISWARKFWNERLEIEPMFDVFNLLNRTQFDPPGNLIAGDLTGTVGHINGTLPSQRTNFRQRGSGTFEQGASRQLQAGLRLTF